MRLALTVAVVSTLSLPAWGDGPPPAVRTGVVLTPPASKQTFDVVPSITGKIQLKFLDADSKVLKCSDLRVSLLGPGSAIGVAPHHNFPDPSFATPVKAHSVKAAAGKCGYSLNPTAAAFGKSLKLQFSGPPGFGYLSKPLGWQNPIVVQKGFDTGKDVEISVSIIH